MAKKKSVKSSKKRKFSKVKTSNFQKFEKEIISEVEDVEKWVLERRKFLIKLLWLLILVTVFLVISNYLFRV